MSAKLEDTFVVVQSSQPGGSSSSFRGTIVNVNDDRIVVCFDTPLGLSPDEPILIGFKDPGTRRFVRAPGVIHSYLTHDPKPMYELAITGEFAHSEQRHDFRVATHGIELTAQLGGERGCTVLDVSPGGLALISHCARQSGECLPITLQYDGSKSCDGSVIVRHVQSITTQRVRCGLQIEPADRVLGRFVHSLAMQVQREQLRRRSRVLCNIQSRKPVPDDEPATGEEAEAPRLSRDSDRPSPTGAGASATFPVDLLIGRSLPGTLRSQDGRVLFRKGATLSARDLDRIRGERLLLGSDWREADPAGVESEFKLGECERRQYDRRAWQVKATVDVHEPHDVRRILVRTRDLSQAGMSFYSRFYIAVGTKLTIEVPMNNRIFKVRGKVVACDYESVMGAPSHCVRVELTESVHECSRLKDAG